MKIHALFALRKYEPTSPELILAWDEYSLDANPTGWEEAKDRAIASLGDEYLTGSVIDINVSEDEVLNILVPHGEVEGTIDRPEPEHEGVNESDDESRWETGLPPTGHYIILDDPYQGSVYFVEHADYGILIADKDTEYSRRIQVNLDVVGWALFNGHSRGN